MEIKPCIDQSQICSGVLQQISEEIRELKGLTIELDKKVDLHIQKIRYELEKIQRTDEDQNKILDEHIAGVNTLRQLYEMHKIENDKRFEQLEEPIKWWNLTKSGIMYLGAIAALVWAVLQIIKWFKP